MGLPKPNMSLIAENPVEQTDPKPETKTAAPGNFASAPQPSPSGSALIPPDLRAGAIDALRDGLKATRRYWSKEQKDFVEEPDYGVRVKTAELVLAYAEGRPVERQVRLSGDFKGFNEKLEQLCATPEGLAMAVKLGLVAEETRKPEKIASVSQVPRGQRKAPVSITVEHAKNGETQIRKSEKNASDS